jgi:cytochrome c oxidase subunit 3
MKIIKNTNTIPLTKKAKEIIKKFHSQQHPYHLVSASPWPFFTSLGVFTFIVGFVRYLHHYKTHCVLMIFGFLLTSLSIGCWFRDIIRESTFEGRHTKKVQLGLKIGMILFILSELMFFFSFFWAFFHSSLIPTIWIGCVWPPKGIITLNPWAIPFLNTILLLLSGAFLTWSHFAIITSNRKDSINSLIITIALGILFTGLQGYEYITAPFNISDGIYGSIFYLATGFHGFHVILGTLLLIVCLYRLVNYHFSQRHHLGFEFASWYWHFVDVIWLFLFLTIYVWGNKA